MEINGMKFTTNQPISQPTNRTLSGSAFCDALKFTKPLFIGASFRLNIAGGRARFCVPGKALPGAYGEVKSFA